MADLSEEFQAIFDYPPSRVAFDASVEINEVLHKCELAPSDAWVLRKAKEICERVSEQ